MLHASILPAACRALRFRALMTSPPPIRPPTHHPLQRQLLFSTFLANTTVGAPDLPADFSTQIQTAWSNFYASSFAEDDPTGSAAQSALGK